MKLFFREKIVDHLLDQNENGYNLINEKKVEREGNKYIKFTYEKKITDTTSKIGNFLLAFLATVTIVPVCLDPKGVKKLWNRVTSNKNQKVVLVTQQKWAEIQKKAGEGEKPTPEPVKEPILPPIPEPIVKEKTVIKEPEKQPQNPLPAVEIPKEHEKIIDKQSLPVQEPKPTQEPILKPKEPQKNERPQVEKPVIEKEKEPEKQPQKPLPVLEPVPKPIPKPQKNESLQILQDYLNGGYRKNAEPIKIEPKANKDRTASDLVDSYLVKGDWENAFNVAVKIEPYTSEIRTVLLVKLIEDRLKKEDRKNALLAAREFPSESEKQIHYAVKLAEEYFREKDIKNAIKAIKTISSGNNQTRIAFLVKIAEICLQEGDTTNAFKAIKANWAAKSEKLASLQAQLAENYLNASNLEMAFKVLDEYLPGEDKRQPDLLRRLAHAYLNINDRESREMAFKVIDKLPLDSEVRMDLFVQLAKSHLDAGEREEAFNIVYYENMPMNNDNRIELLVQLVKARLEANETANIFQLIDKIPEDNILKTSLFVQLAEYFIKNEDQQGALQGALDAIKKIKDNKIKTPILVKIAESYLVAGEREEALNVIQEIQPDDDELKKKLLAQYNV